MWGSYLGFTCGVHIWGSHMVCRCHDMWKQQYATKTHAKKAWQPLDQWLKKPATAAARVARLTSFNKEDNDFHSVVAKCQLRLAQGPNHPWGVAALKPRGYSAITATKKVCLPMTEYSRGLSAARLFCVVCFFFLHFHLIGPHVNIPTHYHSDAVHM